MHLVDTGFAIEQTVVHMIRIPHDELSVSTRPRSRTQPRSTLRSYGPPTVSREGVYCIDDFDSVGSSW
eukprot:6171969-Pleurochrysis_carterae.AAC.3